jgi:protein ImuB
MRRIVSIWLPHWPTDCWRRRRADAGRGLSAERPLALTVTSTGGIRLAAVDALAAMEGLQPGQPLADARALVPELHTAAADPDADRTALAMLADWCLRYTPSVALDGDDGLLLDVTGCAHLFDSEGALIADLVHRLARARTAAKAAIADTPGAAWAVARFGDTTIVPPMGAEPVLMPLPTAALRLPTAVIESLHRLGLRRIGDLLPMPRAPLVARFGDILTMRIDQILGRANEPIALRRPVVLWRSRLVFAEPIARRDDIDAAVRRLLDDLAKTLETAHRGARVLELLFCRVDGASQIVTVGTARPSRDAGHLARLFAEKLDAVDPGFGIEAMIVEAVETDALSPDQADFAGQARDREALAPLIDRLRNRLGERSVFRVAPVASHVPERAIALVPTLSPAHGESWPNGVARPVFLLPCPEPIDANVLESDRPPSDFRWRSLDHRVVKVEGPERIAPEWWRGPNHAHTRDYYWLEDESGRRFWVYRAIPNAAAEPARWYVHGLFA